MFRSAEFRRYFRDIVGAADNTCDTYNSYLGRIDRAIGGLDEAIAGQGPDAVLAWGRSCVAPPFDVRASHARSVLKRYVNFAAGRDDAAAVDDTAASSSELPTPEIEAAAGLAFKIERQLQDAVRRQLSSVEPGLVEADGGLEVPVETGRIDILARSSSGELVVIELKAGACPAGAIEQALGYSQSLAEERGQDVRTIVIASDFSPRQQAAARRIPQLRLARYEFSLRFFDAALAPQETPT